MTTGKDVGYIKLFRKIRNWDYYDDPAMLAVWVHILVGANWDNGDWRGVPVPRGSFITSAPKLAVECGLSEKQVRLCLDKLEKSEQIVRQREDRMTLITICNYDSYQYCEDDEPEVEGKAEVTQKGRERDRQTSLEKAPNKEDKENKELYQKEKVSKDTQKKDSIVDALYSLYPTKCPVSGRATGKCSKNKRQIESLLKNRDASDVEFIIRDYITDCKNHNTYIKNFTTFLNQFPDKEQPRPSAQAQQPVPVQQKSPEVMAIEAMHAGASEQVVRQGILFAHEGISEERLNAALRNAGYLQ